MLLNREKGFGVGPTVNPCTKGLWIWGTAIAGLSPDGEALNVLIIDTEGLGALDEDSNHDARVFSLALLLSSYFIYNSVGSIDETALQNLNLVVSLTKHIQIKAQTKAEDAEPEEYSKYLPSFMWVLRDFTLQLLDEDGEPITSKEYFERSLQPQAGYSEAIEHKNKIRRLIKSFFPERDCYTIVRPLTNEEHLQELEKINLEQLRPEFIEQIMILRRKIINMIKPKMLNSKTLNGEMLLNLAESYVTAINNGAVPNIENAWTYICKSECRKALHLALEKYDANIEDLMYNHGPLNSTEFKAIHKEAYSIALQEFNKTCVGPNTEEYLKELKKKIKAKYSTLEAENEREAKKHIHEFLTSAYMEIERKLRNHEFNTFEEYLEELRGFQMYFLENGPPGPHRKTLMLEYCQRMQSEVADMFFNKLRTELELEKSVNQSTMQKMEQMNNELKEEYKTEIEKMSGKLRIIETEKVEFSAKEQGLRENCNSLLKEKFALEREMAEKLDEQAKDYERNMKLLREKIAQQEEIIISGQERILTAESNSGKSQALLEQKIDYLEKTLEESREKEKEYANELKSIKSKHVEAIKEMTLKDEGLIKELQRKVEDEKEQVRELETELMEMQQQYENEKIQSVSELESLIFKVQEYEKLIPDLKNKIDKLANKNTKDKKALEEVLNKERTESQTKMIEMEKVVKTLREEMKTAKVKWQKEEAIRNQKQEFYEVQLSEARKQLEEAQKSHEIMIRALQGKGNTGQENDMQLISMKENHLGEVKELERIHEEARKRLTAQLEQAVEKASSLELKLKLQETDYQKILENKTESITSLQSQLEKANQQIKFLEQQKMKLLEEAEQNYKKVIEDLEIQMEENKKKHQADIREIQKYSEDALEQLRSVYEIEKERLQTRILEEKEKNGRICAQQLEDHETKLKEEQQQRAEEVQALHNDLEECELRSREIITKLEQKEELYQQKIKTLEVQLKDAKDQFTQFQTMNSKSLEQHMLNFSEERKTMLDKIERLSSEITEKERLIINLENKTLSLQQDIIRNAKAMDEWKAEKLADKNELQEKIINLRAKNQQISNDLMQKKLEYSRESALLKQQGEFLNHKIRELQENIKDITNRYEEKLNIMKQEHNQQLKDTIERLSKDKEQYEQKYEDKKKILKEMETNITLNINKLEKEKVGLTDKCKTLELRNKELEKQYNKEISMLQIKLKEALSRDCTNNLQENEKFKKAYMEIDRELCEIQANYEKDKELWKDRFVFLEQQRDQYKSDLIEAQRKFELTLEQLQKRGTIDKDKSETNQMALISSLEQKHKYQIKELNESHQHIYNELIQRNKQLEKEVKVMTEKKLLEQRIKQNELNAVEKKANDNIEALERVTRELEEAKADKDKKALEYQKLFEKERDNYKAKLQEIESKYSEIDGKRGIMIMEFEKERAKWSLERDHLLLQKSEAQEIIVRLEKRKENLMIENDKLKSERAGKKHLYSSVTAPTSVIPKYTNKCKENSNTSKISMIGDKGVGGDYGAKTKLFNKSSRSSLVKGADINP